MAELVVTITEPRIETKVGRETLNALLDNDLVVVLEVGTSNLVIHNIRENERYADALIMVSNVKASRIKSNVASAMKKYRQGNVIKPGNVKVLDVAGNEAIVGHSYRVPTLPDVGDATLPDLDAVELDSVENVETALVENVENA